MENSQLDNQDVDVEKLISFIKRKAQERRARELASEPLASTGEQPTEPERQDEPVDASLPVEPDSVFKIQAEFNHQLMLSLALFGDYIKGLQQGLARNEGRLHEETVRSLRSTQQIKDQIGDFTRIVEDLKAQTETAVVRAAENQQRISRELNSVKQVAESLVRAEADKSAREARQLAAQVTDISAALNGLSEKTDNLYVKTTHLERVLPALSEAQQATQSNLSLFEGRMKQQGEQNATTFCNLEEQLARHLSELSDVSHHADAVNARAKQVEQKVIHELDELRIRVLRAERVTKDARKTSIVLGDPLAPTEPALSDQAKPSSDRPNGNGLHEVASSSARMLASQPFDYFLFEHRFRGPLAEIKLHHTIYLDLFQGRENVLDLGCGRGEFVELLAERGVKVTGVDINEDMVDICRDRGLNVQLADVFSHLNSLSDNYLDGIFTSQVIEHLSFDQLLVLISLCGRKLKRDGIIVAETVNPNCFDALSNFYLDPSHVRPIPGKMLWFLFEQKHFRAESLIYSSPVSSHLDKTLNTNFDLPTEVSLYKDYALVAAKT